MNRDLVNVNPLFLVPVARGVVAGEVRFCWIIQPCTVPQHRNDAEVFEPPSND